MLMQNKDNAVTVTQVDTSVKNKDFMSMKNSDTSWDRTSNLPICSAAP
jgi:hypothetical protein